MAEIRRADSADALTLARMAIQLWPEGNTVESLEKEFAESGAQNDVANFSSFLFHRAAGFAEANRIICFTKRL